MNEKTNPFEGEIEYGTPEVGVGAHRVALGGHRVALGGVSEPTLEWNDASLGGRADGAEPGETTKFNLVPFEDIKFAGSDEWLVKKLLPRQGVAALYGAPKSFKSFIGEDIGLHVALGWPWAGRATTRGPVVYIAAENAAGVRKRKVGFEMTHAGHLPHRVPFYLIGAAPDLGTENNDLSALIAAIAAVGVVPVLIVIDTLAQTLCGGEENGGGMMNFVSKATALANHYKACVIAVHHVPLADDKRLRGHTSLHGGVDAQILADRNNNEMTTSLSLEKLKDEEDGFKLTAHLVRIVIGHDGDGDEISTLVVDRVEEGDDQATKGQTLKSIPRQRRLLMEVVEQAIDEAGRDIKSFSDGPMVRAVSDEIARTRFYARIAEEPLPDETAEKLKKRQRKAYNRAVDGALNAKDLVAKEEGGVRVLWLP